MTKLKFPISELFYSEVGTTNTLEVELPQVFHQEAKLAEGQKIQVIGMKIEDAVCFYLENQEFTISFNCVRCLKPTTKTTPLRDLEKHYYVSVPEDVDDDLVELIDKKNFEVDLTTFIEESILLSIPTLLICGEDCPGPPTFSNNESNPDQNSSNSPFSKLKDLIN